MQPKQMTKLKKRLLAELEMEQEIHKFGMETSMNDAIGELSGYDNHPADIGSEMFERGKDLALKDDAQRHHEEIMAALTRMDKGVYGKCERCGESIPIERLEILPWTRYCVTHSQEHQVKSQRPVEEDVILQTQKEQLNREDSGYNGEDTWQELERYGTSNPPDFFREGTSYNDLTIDHDEHRGYVEDVEQVATSELDGKPSDELR